MVRPRDAVLGWVNQTRAEHGLPTLAELPPDVTPDDDLSVRVNISANCPIAKAFDTACGFTTLYIREVDRVEIPRFVRQFMKSHDNRLVGRKNSAPVY
ncbi:MAG: hypothetical protein ACXVHB_05800 [Solirubrobacteraceae bacterium]